MVVLQSWMRPGDGQPSPGYQPYFEQLMTRRKSAFQRDPALPPLFTGEEWCEIVDRLALSPRQAQVLGLVIQSRKDKEIATLLEISHATVRTHIGEAKSRMVAVDRVGLAYRVFWTFRQAVEPKRYPWFPRTKEEH